LLNFIIQFEYIFPCRNQTYKSELPTQSQGKKGCSWRPTDPAWTLENFHLFACDTTVDVLGLRACVTDSRRVRGFGRFRLLTLRSLPECMIGRGRTYGKLSDVDRPCASHAGAAISRRRFPFPSPRRRRGEMVEGSCHWPRSDLIRLNRHNPRYMYNSCSIWMPRVYTRNTAPNSFFPLYCFLSDIYSTRMIPSYNTLL
jgi:hypothetical protein